MHQLPTKCNSQLLLSELVAADVIMFIRKETNQTNHHIIPLTFKIFIFLAQGYKLIGGCQELYCL